MQTLGKLFTGQKIPMMGMKRGGGFPGSKLGRILGILSLLAPVGIGAGVGAGIGKAVTD
jgi:hypothetical protein